ncbi:MAG: ribose-5-phosphate isomerase RpiA [Burkholderiaceae bacterium]
MGQDQLKALVGRAALAYMVPGSIVGVGTGSTVNCFIDALAGMRNDIKGAVSSSDASSARLRAHGIDVIDANEVENIPVYIDGADEIDPRGHMIKGGGAALTREKIVADLAERFVCIADASKRVDVLGRFPLPIEVVPMASAQIMRKLRGLGGAPLLRTGLNGPIVTDNGGHIVDVRGLHIDDPLALEAQIEQWPGVVTVGLFARQKAALCLLATPEGVLTLTF